MVANYMANLPNQTAVYNNTENTIYLTDTDRYLTDRYGLTFKQKKI